MQKRFYKPYKEYFIIETGDPNVPVTGSLVTSGNSVNILSGQPAAVITRPFGSYAVNDFLAGSQTISNAPYVKFVQGTPNATDNSSAAGWFNEDIGWVETPEIGPNTISAVGCFLPNIGKYSADCAGTFDKTFVEDQDYRLIVKLRSTAKDTDYGNNVDEVNVGFLSADLTPYVDDRGWILQNLLYKVNLQSKLNNIIPPYLRYRTKELICLAINSAGSNAGGTVLGTLGLGDSIPVQTDGTTTLSWVVDKPLIQTLTDAIANCSDISATSTIETIDLSVAGTGTPATGTFQVTAFANFTGDTITIGTTALVEGVDFSAVTSDEVTATNLAAAIDAVTGFSAVAVADTVTVTSVLRGTAANSIVWTYTDGGTSAGTISGSGTLTGAADTNVDTFLVVGLDRDLAQAYDNIQQRKTTVELVLGGQFYTDDNGEVHRAAGAEELRGDGRSLKIIYDQSAFAQTGSQQLSGNNEELLLAPNYIVESAMYTETVIDVRNDQETPIGSDVPNNYRVRFLVLATDDSGSATPGGGGITTSTASTTTAGDLETVVGSWVQSHDNVTFNGSANATTTFV